MFSLNHLKRNLPTPRVTQSVCTCTDACNTGHRCSVNALTNFESIAMKGKCIILGSNACPKLEGMLSFPKQDYLRMAYCADEHIPELDRTTKSSYMSKCNDMQIQS